ncbi:MAG: alpha-ketoglutarate-dependent dioxygenase AlkB [Saccharospirillaceae bacterium]|nr:alpha-ketoglutarate-dependent dioxygenase AlkB [Pseudomonadales bacterium]NRB79026.1 alpha-ketoglutarate-dependent dioxygenase AlkB [Saccharospirillaceae bacterium]
MSLFEHDVNENLLPFDGDVNYFGEVLTFEQTQYFFEALLNNIDWQHDEVLINGKLIRTQRKVSWHSGQSSTYQYSGSTKLAKPWTTELLKLKTIVEKQTGEIFNSCLLNLYETGNQGMGYHSDNETQLGVKPIIASLSLGATRKFVFKHKQTKHTCGLDLSSGSLLVMKGDTQDHWQHSLPITAKCHSARINLTFRVIGSTV